MTDELDLDMVICDCSGTTTGKVLDLINSGCDLDTISRKTGAFSGCGGCEYDLQILFETHSKSE